MRHFDVQILGGVALVNGSIAEMQTGEGKTLTATLPLYLHALAGKGAHLATVNDYLAHRDAEWMRPLYELLGLSVGVIQTKAHAGPAPRGLCVRHYLRHGKRVWVRLLARPIVTPTARLSPGRLFGRDERSSLGRCR